MITINSFQIRPGVLQPGNYTSFIFDLSFTWQREDDNKAIRLHMDLMGDDNTDRSPRQPVNPSASSSYQPNTTGDPVLQTHIYERIIRLRPASWLGIRSNTISDQVWLSNNILDEDQLDEIPDEQPGIFTGRRGGFQYDEPYFLVKIYRVNDAEPVLLQKASNVRLAEYAPH